jgi:flagellar biosynthesis/type III secretory pathway M-ring protein FliF/YscJ
MSNQPYSKNPKTPPNVSGENKPLSNPAKTNTKPAATPQDPAAAKEEQIKKILSQLADKDPANIAEIIHQWLNEDKK